MQQQQIQQLKAEIQEKTKQLREAELEEEYQEFKEAGIQGSKEWVVFFRKFKDLNVHRFLLKEWHKLVDLPAAIIEFYDADATLLGNLNLPANYNWEAHIASAVRNCHFSIDKQGDVFQPIKVEYTFHDEPAAPFSFCILKYNQQL